jgi:ABC-type nitrate/sulfonate/bicarbonate transport system substrate-binding protein
MTMACRLPATIAAFLIVIWGLTGVQNAVAAEGETLKIGVSQNEAGLGTIPFIMAQRQNAFAREGVNIELVRFGGPTLIDVLWNQYAGLARGEVGLIRSQAPFLIEQVMKGGDFVAIAANTTNPVHVLVARPEIRTFADLKGKVVAVTKSNDAITVATRKLMALHGIGATDVTLKAIEGSGPRFDCLKSGECAAASVGQPTDYQAVAQGFHRLGLSNEAGPVMFGLEVVNNAWARAHEDVLVRYLRAFASGLRYANDPNNDADMIKLLMEAGRTDETVARDMLRTYRDPKYRVLSRQGEIDPEGFARMIALEGEFGELATPLPDASRFVDRRYLTAAGIR